MQGTRHRWARGLGRFSLVLSVFALSALTIFPALVQAEDASGIQYSEAPPNPYGGHKPVHKPEAKDPPAHSSSDNGGAAAPKGSGHSDSSGSESSEEDSSSTAAGAPSGKGDGGTGQGNPGNGSKGTSPDGSAAPVQHSGQAQNVTPASEESSSGSSPLVPILIAIGVLAAISIAFMMLRAKRQRPEGRQPVSPEAS